MSDLKRVEEVDYTGKFKAGDEVKIVAAIHGPFNYVLERKKGEVGIIDDMICRDSKYPYGVKFGDTKYWFNEAELELVKPFTEQGEMKMREIKVVEEVEYTGKFKVRDEVRVVGVTSFKDAWKHGLKNVGSKGFINKITDFINITSYPYRVELENGSMYWFNEAELELVKPFSKQVDDIINEDEPNAPVLSGDELRNKIMEMNNIEPTHEVELDEVAIHSEIITRLVKQTIKGVSKYGQAVKFDNLSTIEWIDHAIDESIDQIVYLTALKQSLQNKE